MTDINISSNDLIIWNDVNYIVKRWIVQISLFSLRLFQVFFLPNMFIESYYNSWFPLLNVQLFKCYNYLKAVFIFMYLFFLIFWTCFFFFYKHAHSLPVIIITNSACQALNCSIITIISKLYLHFLNMFFFYEHVYSMFYHYQL